MVVGFTITLFFCTYVISAYHNLRCEFESRSGEVYSIQHYVINLPVTCDRSVVFSGYSVIENAKNEAKPNQMYFSQAKKKIGCIE
jgi:hypothetical protein